MIKNQCYVFQLTKLSATFWFRLKIKEYTNISNFILKLTIVPPDLRFVRTRNEILKEKPLGIWTEILVGEFKMSPQNVGNMTFRLEETITGSWKSGLLVKCAIIRPKNQEALRIVYKETNL